MVGVDGGWGADLCPCGDGFADEDLALGEVVGHGCCRAELADCLGGVSVLGWLIDGLNCGLRQESL